MTTLRRVAIGLGAGAAGAGVIALSVRGREASLAVRLAHMELKLRPVLSDVLPHDVYVWLYSASRPAVAWALAQPPISVPTSASTRDGDSDERAKQCGPRSAMGGLRFRNDLGNAAGFDKDGSLLSWSYTQGAGFAVVGTVLNEPHTGNLFSLLGGLWRGTVWMPLPRCGGSLNSLGLPSYGVDQQGAEDDRVGCLRVFQSVVEGVKFLIVQRAIGQPCDEGKIDKFLRHSEISICLKND